MKQVLFYLLSICVFIVFLTCNIFEQDDFIPFITFEITLGGGGVDIGNDVIELPSGYLVVGAAGPECDIMDAISMILDKETGQTIQFNHYGRPGEGNEDNFFDVQRISDNEFAAVGFSSPKAEIVPYDTCLTCRVYDEDFEIDTIPPCGASLDPRPMTNGNIFFARFDTSLNLLSSMAIPSNSPISRWDAGYSLSVQNENYYIAGAWHAFNAVLKTDSNEMIEETAIRDGLVGEYRDVDVFGEDDFVATGFAHCFSAPLICPQNEVDLATFYRTSSAGFIEKFYSIPNIKSSCGESITKAESDGFLIAGFGINLQDEQRILLIRVEDDGTKRWTKIIEKEGSALDISKIEDGYILTGDINDDLFIMKIDFDGNEIWTETYDYLNLNNKQGGKSIIQTEDGGFLAVGNSFNSDGTSSTIYVVKTDATGKVR